MRLDARDSRGDVLVIGEVLTSSPIVRAPAHFQAVLRDAFADHALVGEVRGVGLMAALEFVADRERKQRFDPALGAGPRVAAAALDPGLIARAMPHGMALARRAVDRVAREVLG